MEPEAFEIIFFLAASSDTADSVTPPAHKATRRTAHQADAQAGQLRHHHALPVAAAIDGLARTARMPEQRMANRAGRPTGRRQGASKAMWHDLLNASYDAQNGLGVQ